MIYVIGVICLAVFAWSIYFFYDSDGILGAILGGLAGILFDFLIFFFAGLICYVIMSCYDDAKCDVVYDTKTELVALKDDGMIFGHSFLGSGYIDEELKYVYIYEDPVKGMKADRVDADYAYIKYIDENENPYIQSWHMEPKNGFVNFMIGDFANTYYTIYLPEGSIITDTYNIDLE